MDDSEEALLGKKVNVYFYKDGKYSRALGKIAPTEFKNVVEQFSEDDVVYWKGKAEAYFEKFVEPKMKEKSEVADTSVTSESDDLPF